MATVTLTYAAGGNAGSNFRRLAHQIEKAASVVPDNTPTGASIVLTIDNNPSSGTASVAITQASGPCNSGTLLI